MATITDLIYGTVLLPGVVPKLNYRSDIVQNVPRWIVAATRYITDTYPFEELCIIGPVVQLTLGVSEYDISTFLFTTVLEPISPITRFDSFVLYLPNPVNVGLASNPCIELKWRNMKVVQQLSRILGMPVMYTIYGAWNGFPYSGDQRVIVAMCPNNTWSVQASYQIKHPFIDGVTDIIRVPDAWLEVIVCTAALIGAEENRMTDNIQLLRAVLYGDPANPQKPGLINALVSSRAQFSNVNERMLNMVAEI